MTPILDKLQGSMVALITPMHSNGDVDWQSFYYEFQRPGYSQNAQ